MNKYCFLVVIALASCNVDVHDNKVESNSRTDEDISIDGSDQDTGGDDSGNKSDGDINIAPQVVGVSLGTGPYYTNDSIQVVVADTVDPDGDSVTLSYEWFVDDEVVAGEQGNTLSGTHFAKGQKVQVKVKPNDGKVDGAVVASNTVIIQNSAPLGLTAFIDGGLTYYAKSSISASYTEPVDPDGDEVTVSYQWFRNGVPVAFATTATYSGGIHYDSLYVEITPSDGAPGIPVQSNTVYIANTPPEFQSGSLGSGPYFKTSTINTLTAGWNDDDGDGSSFVCQWYVDSALVSGVSGCSLTGAKFSKGQTVYAIVTPFDGYETGRSIITASVTIQNSPPSLSSVSIGNGPYYKTSTITSTNAVPTDVDGDPAFVTIAWYVAGSPVPGQNGTTLSGAYFSKGATVYSVVTPTDTYDAGQPKQSNVVTILNTAPSAPAISLYPTDPTSGAVMYVGVNSPAVDIDGDSLTYQYTWTKNGSVQPYPNSQTVAGSHAPRDVWSVSVRANDGTALGPAVSKQTTVVYDWLSIRAGYATVCGITPATSALCWGRLLASSGQSAFVPDPVNGLESGVVLLSKPTSEHACAVMSNGTVRCWGANDRGQLGVDPALATASCQPPGYSLVPCSVVAIEVQGINDAVEVETSGRSSCALLASGAVKCWGIGYLVGQGTYTEYNQCPADPYSYCSSVPLTVIGLRSGVAELSSGSDHYCARLGTGEVRCWGNSYTSGGSSYSPVTLPTLSSVSNLSSFGSGMCAKGGDGYVYCQGYNQYGSVGDGTTTNRSVATKIASLGVGVAQLEGGGYANCARYADFTVRCWGYNRFGGLGTGANTGPNLCGGEACSTSPTPASALPSQIRELTLNNNFLCYLSESRAAYCLGYNGNEGSLYGVLGSRSGYPEYLKYSLTPVVIK